MLATAAQSCDIALRMVSYEDLLNGRVDLEGIGQGCDCVRVDSPGENFSVEQLLLIRGAKVAAESGSPFMPPESVHRLSEDLGRIHYPWQYFLGFQSALVELETRLPGKCWMNTPAAMAAMFNKLTTNKLLSENGIPIPQQLGLITSFEQLEQLMATGGHSRVFLKLVASSSASGVVALHKFKDKWRAVTTVEVDRSGDEYRLYNSLRLSVLSEQEQIAELITLLVPHQLFAELWVPKAAYDHQSTFDMRVVVVDGQPTHFVPRVSRSPLTNLHLGNRRGNFEQIQQRMGERSSDFYELCSRAAKAIPGCLYTGLDVVIKPSFREFTILEANACGDLLPGIVDEAGRDTYATELTALRSS